MYIGRVVKEVQDDTRKEINCTNQNRTIIMSVFYPSDEMYCKDKIALYKDLYQPNVEPFIQEWGDTKESLQYINNLTTHTYINVPIKDTSDKYPVLIYSPGFSCDRDSTVFIIERLVEQGYIVITLGCLYETDYTVMPNGDVIESLDMMEELITDSNGWKQVIDIRKKDVLFLIDYLEYMNKNDELLKNRLLIDKIGLLGFSIGAQACFEAAADDQRIKAVVLLEGCLHYSTVIERVRNGQCSKTPYLLFKKHASSLRLREEESHSLYQNLEDKKQAEELINEEMAISLKIVNTQKALYEFIEGYKSFVKIENTDHMTFSDIPVLSNQPYFECFDERITTNYAHEIISITTLKFLNEFLYGNVNEYKNFIKDNMIYPKLKEIDADGEVVQN